MKEENIVAPKKEFDALLKKLLDAPPLPKAAIPAKMVRRSVRPARTQKSPKQGQ